MNKLLRNVALSTLATSAAIALPLVANADNHSVTIQADYYRKTAFQEMYGGGKYIGPRKDVTTAPVGQVLPRTFKLPITTEIFRDTTITSTSPITDAIGVSRNSSDVARWGEAIAECLQEKPKLVRVLTGNTVYINNVEGTIVENANGVLVCPR
ncbi:hypothetical protein [Roseofilum casamattae]|uniref:Uncharacterized protein n=1 Tax=Roseofilum casamattae BLCC-M143 TaxID=3022442 RepID=A0ABT7C0C0_9CYAN|nr:hypothetical protein [Roseofilum casamattae]MDJ1184131.1 hypothetical protein [Roseofilum casamattae BLCC-M143]